MRRGRQAVARAMMEQIRTGRWGPGMRIPTQSELEKHFDAYSVTVQEALGELTDAGFLRARGRAGTFIVDRPPHLNRLALVFPVMRSEVGRSRFWLGLLDAADRVERQHPGTFRIFYDVEFHQSSRDYQELHRLVQSGALAGIIFASNPSFPMAGSPVLTHPGVPRVAIRTPRPEDTLPSVYNDMGLFIERAMERVALPLGRGRGRRRVAAIVPTGRATVALGLIQEVAGRHGLCFEPRWLQFADLMAPESARHAAMLLLHPSGADRPDCLIIADDHLVEPVTEGMLASGARVAPAGRAPARGEVHVVAMCHFAAPPSNPMGFEFLGSTVQCCWRRA